MASKIEKEWLSIEELSNDITVFAGYICNIEEYQEMYDDELFELAMEV